MVVPTERWTPIMLHFSRKQKYTVDISPEGLKARKHQINPVHIRKEALVLALASVS